MAFTWGRKILGRNPDKSLKSFPRSYSKSLPQLCLEIYISSNSFKLFQFLQFILHTVKEKGGKPDREPYLLPYALRNPYRNLKSRNSQDYAQKSQRNCAFMNSASLCGIFHFYHFAEMSGGKVLVPLYQIVYFCYVDFIPPFAYMVYPWFINIEYPYILVYCLCTIFQLCIQHILCVIFLLCIYVIFLLCIHVLFLLCGYAIFLLCVYVLFRAIHMSYSCSKYMSHVLFLLCRYVIFPVCIYVIFLLCIYVLFLLLYHIPALSIFRGERWKGLRCNSNHYG